MSVVLQSDLSCPSCRYTTQETMPTDVCQFYYECSNCKTLLRPQPGHCCVFCSYGSVPCPPIQQARQISDAVASQCRKAGWSIAIVDGLPVRMKLA